MPLAGDKLHSIYLWFSVYSLSLESYRSPHSLLLSSAVLFKVAFIPEPTVTHRPPFRTCKSSLLQCHNRERICRRLDAFSIRLVSRHLYLLFPFWLTTNLKNQERWQNAAGTAPIYQYHLSFIIQLPLMYVPHVVDTGTAHFTWPSYLIFSTLITMGCSPGTLPHYTSRELLIYVSVSHPEASKRRD